MSNCPFEQAEKANFGEVFQVIILRCTPVGMWSPRDIGQSPIFSSEEKALIWAREKFQGWTEKIERRWDGETDDSFWYEWVEETSYGEPSRASLKVLQVQ